MVFLPHPDIQPKLKQMDTLKMQTIDCREGFASGVSKCLALRETKLFI
jgi:hypothetical protein